MVIELILMASITLLSFVYLKTRRIYKLTENIPGERAYPLIGHAYMALQIRKMADMAPVIEKLSIKYKEYGITKFLLGPFVIIGISIPKYIQAIANSQYTKSKGDVHYQGNDAIANGVFITSGGTKWRELRKPLVNSLAKTIVVSDYHHVFVERSKKYAQYIRQHKLGVEFDLFQTMTNLSLDIFSETLLGVETNEVVDNKFNFVENVHVYIETLIMNTIRFRFVFKKLGEHFTHVGKALRRSKHEINRFLQWILDERMISSQICKGSTEYYSDFLLRRAGEKKISLVDIRRELADLVIAGSDTSSVAASSALVFLAMFPHIQEKAYQEQLSIFGHTQRDVTADDLDSMVYLRMVIKETLRLVGIHGLIRSVSEDFTLDKYTLPKGASIYISLKTVHQDIKYWEKPKDFYPEHFLPEKEAERPSYAYNPFGIAPRVCPGYVYGMNSMLVTLSTLLRNFEIKTRMKYENIELDYKLMLHFISGYNVKFMERNKV